MTPRWPEKTAKEIGDSVRIFKVDVTDTAAVEQARDATLAAFGKIDILVNNAGIAGVNKPVWETDLEEWRKVLRINLDGPFIVCKAIVPTMLKQKYGRIVNIASIAGKEGNPNASHYSASKAGLIALTKSLGKELAAHDILVNAVTPAAAKTAIFDQMTQQHIDFMLSKIPKARVRAGGRARRDGGLARIGGLRVLDRRRVRHLRRAGNILRAS
ncbi:NAD(P)-dependent dehydrogenase (short-subunit alcohol dehydrogenase family) [Bradyrhizobium sp. LM3.2]